MLSASPHDHIVASAFALLAGMCVHVPPEARIGLVQRPVERGPTSVRVSAYWDGGAIWVNVLSAEYEAVEDGDVIALAGVLAHETYHALHGPAERAASTSRSGS